MFNSTYAFSGFSIDDADAAEAFYTKLGLTVERNAMGFLNIHLPGTPGPTMILAYVKPDHVPGTYTILNFQVDDVEAKVDELNAAGIHTKIYDGLWTDEKGIARGQGPDIAWFKDPAGNVLSVLNG
jgi:catechol 2,3-dioxygenase-like lactoylglutathione lyase family enzyme